MAAGNGADRRCRPLDRRLAQLAGMGIARRFARNRPQTEALTGIEGRGFDPAIVEDDTLGLAVFQEQLTIIHA